MRPLALGRDEPLPLVHCHLPDLPKTAGAQRPEWSTDCVLLLLPSADGPMAQCALLPGRLGKVPVSKLSESAIDTMLEPMEGSRALAGEDQQETQVPCEKIRVSRTRSLALVRNPARLSRNSSTRLHSLRNSKQVDDGDKVIGVTHRYQRRNVLPGRGWILHR